MTKCPACKEETIFEGVNENMVGSAYQILIIRCPLCKTAISSMENIIAEKSLNRILSKVLKIEESIEEIKLKIK